MLKSLIEISRFIGPSENFGPMNLEIFYMYMQFFNNYLIELTINPLISNQDRI